jgi:hypothetical protein
MNNDRRQVVAFMAFAAIFALIGHTVKSTTGQSKAGSDVKIILGAGLGTVLLTLLAEAGDGGASFAKGLAALTLISSVLINGTPVFSAVSNLTSKTASSPKLVTTPMVG